MWCLDNCTLKTRIRGSTQKLQLFSALDLGTGKVVAWCVHQDMSAARIVECIDPPIKRLYNKFKAGFPGSDILLIHTDQGSEFTSGLFQNLAAVYQNFVYTSMSHRSTPTNNAVVERMFSTLVRNGTCWSKISNYQKEPEVVESIHELRDLYTDLINYFNQELRQPRAMYLTPSEAETAFEVAEILQLQKPEVLLTENQFSLSDEHREITVYRSQVKDSFTNAIVDIPRTDHQFQQQEVVRRNLFDYQRTKEFFDQQTDLLKHLVSVVEELKPGESLKANKRPKRHPVPRPMRDPMWTKYLLFLEELLYNNKTLTLCHTRNLVDMVIMFGTGIRCSDAHIITQADRGTDRNE